MKGIIIFIISIIVGGLVIYAIGVDPNVRWHVVEKHGQVFDEQTGKYHNQTYYNEEPVVPYHVYYPVMIFYGVIFAAALILFIYSIVGFFMGEY